MKKETLLATLSCASDNHSGIVNVPVYRASTILFPTLADFESAEHGQFTHPTYARYGTRSTEALEHAIATLEGADCAIAVATGIAAIAVSLMAFLKTGDHLLMPDTVYGSTRRLCNHELKRFGVEVTYYDPLVGTNIAALIKDNTKVVFVESPGSLTFEMQDIPAIAKAAHAKGAVVIGDNTWATPMFIEPFALGMDVSIHSATKYIGGHSDLMMGMISCKEKHAEALRRAFGDLGACPSGDNCYLALRGLRSMGVRLRQHQESALKVAAWLKGRPEVEAVLHPALPGAPGHDIWKRDFTGACGLFGVVLHPVSMEALANMFDHMELFGMGYSWGGFESLAIPVHLDKVRTATRFPYKGQPLRLHIGLEHPDDIIADLEAGFKRLKKI